MVTRKEPLDVTLTIKRSIEVSKKHSRMVRLHRLRQLYGFHAWSAVRRAHVEQLLSEQGVAFTPTLQDAQADDWIRLSLCDDQPMVTDQPAPAPSPGFLEYLQSLTLTTEREVELHFTSPLFDHLGYDDVHEAAGFRFDLWQGVQHHSVEADLLYFADGPHDLVDGNPLVLVECKAPSKAPDTGVGQARSYAYWIKPAYYVITNGDWVAVYLYQGGSVPDVKKLETSRSRLATDFAELYQLLNPAAALEARRQKLAIFAAQHSSSDGMRFDEAPSVADVRSN